jgi:hypothetical protein
MVWLALSWVALIGFGLLHWLEYEFAPPKLLAGAWFLLFVVIGGSMTALRIVELSIHVPEKLHWYEDADEALLVEASKGAFILYLRNLTFDQLVEGEVFAGEGGVARMTKPRPIESALVTAAETIGVRVVAIWSPSDKNTHKSFEYLSVGDGNWKKLVETLVWNAKSIVVLLREGTPGVLFESTLIGNARNLASRTLLLAPTPSHLAQWRDRIPGLRAGCVVPPCLLDRRYNDGALERDNDNRATAIFDLSVWLEGGFRKIMGEPRDAEHEVTADGAPRRD